MSLVVHHLNNSRSQRVLWLLEELELAYEIRHHERDPETRLAPQSLKDVHQLGKSPIIEHGGKIIAETGCIIEYLMSLRPGTPLEARPDNPMYWQYRFYMHHAEGSGMPPLVMQLIFNSIKERKMPFFAKPIARQISDKVIESFIAPQLKNLKKLWANDLAQTGWFGGGSLTAADIMMSFPVEAMGQRSAFTQDEAALQDFLNRIHGRDAWKRALDKGGPYIFA